MSNPDMVQRLLTFTRILTEEEIDLSAEQLLCFLTVASRPGMSVTELVAETGLPQSTVSRHLRNLSSGLKQASGGFGGMTWELEVGRKALIEQRVHPENAKQKALHVAPDGEALIASFERALNGA